MIRAILIAALMLPALAFGRIDLPPMFKEDQVAASGLTETQAQQLVVMILKHGGRRVGGEGWFIETLKTREGEPFVKGYIAVSLGYDTPKAGATQYTGIYLVSPRTGDVWVFDLCKHPDFPALRKVQRMISRRTGKTVADEAMDRKAIGCE